MNILNKLNSNKKNLMSKENHKQINYNLNKLNFGKIKNELKIIPQIIRNHKKLGLHSCLSASNIYNNKYISITNNSNKDLNENENRNKYNNKRHKGPTLKKSKTIQMSNIDDINIINNLNNNNLNSKTSINNTLLNEEDMIFQIKLENNRQINKIKKSYEKKISELNLFYENKFINLNKLLKNNISDFTKLSKNFISLDEHNKILNDIKKTYNDLLQNTKYNYEKIINDLTDIMKQNIKYKDLIHRLQLYTKYEIDIEEIEKKIVENLNEKINNEINNKDYFKDFYLITQLDEDINYHKKICEMNQLYNEKLAEIRLNQNNKFNNLTKYVQNLFENQINIYENNEIKNINNNIKKQNLKLYNNIINNKSQALFKEKENKSNSNSEKSHENNNHSSSKEIEQLLNIPDSYESRLKPEIMEMKIFEKNK